MEETLLNLRASNSKETFIAFLNALISDLKINADTWENKSLESYLEAMQSWIEDMDGYYINNGKPIPTKIDWETFGDILIGAKVYE